MEITSQAQPGSQGDRRFDNGTILVYGRTPNKSVGRQRFEERARELRAIMSEEFGLEVTDEECHRLALALVNVFRALSAAGTMPTSESANNLMTQNRNIR